MNESSDPDFSPETPGTTQRQTASPHAAVNVLIVEDDRSYVGLIRTMLESGWTHTFVFEQATSLHQALDCIRRTEFDVVLLDLNLEDARGIVALTGITKVAPDVPIVILSGDDDLSLSLRAVKQGAQDYLVKTDVTPDTLTRSLLFAIERKHAERETKRVALRDSLTNLPNRRLMLEQLIIALHRAKRLQRVLGIFFIDLDHFKHVNDTLGHDAGDAILQQVAARLRHVLRASDIVARLSGDEFVAVVDANRRADLIAKAAGIEFQLRQPFAVRNEEVFMTASIGVSSYPADGVDQTTLLRNADRAMYRAKAEGRDTHRFYSSREYAQAANSVRFRSGLRQALDRAELRVEFQPIVNLRGGGIDGVEALVRWQHPGLGCVLPGNFIPVAEESGLILSLEHWVLNVALREVAQLDWKRPLRVAVNLSTRHFDQSTLTTELRTLTKQIQYDPRLLELELTESGIMRHPKRVVQHLKAFRRLGVRVAIDDFGTGYSCLSLMNRFPLHALKIDRSFVADCATNPTNRALVSAIIQMGHALGLEVTAEGVETAEQLEYVRQCGCDRAQGWLFSAPVASAELPRVLESLESLA